MKIYSHCLLDNDEWPYARKVYKKVSLLRFSSFDLYLAPSHRLPTQIRNVYKKTEFWPLNRSLTYSLEFFFMKSTSWVQFFVLYRYILHRGIRNSSNMCALLWEHTFAQ